MDTTVLFSTSACICRQNELRAPPPEARICFTVTPSSSIIARQSRSEYVTPSMMARTKWPRPCFNVRPTNAPRAFGSAWGVRSPARYGRNNNPSAPGGVTAASSVSTSYASIFLFFASVISVLQTALRNHWSEPPAASVTPIMCHLPLTAWQNVCSRPSGSTCGVSLCTNTTPEVPIDVDSTPLFTMPLPTAPAAQSPAPPTTMQSVDNPSSFAVSEVSLPV